MDPRCVFSPAHPANCANCKRTCAQEVRVSLYMILYVADAREGEAISRGVCIQRPDEQRVLTVYG